MTLKLVVYAQKLCRSKLRCCGQGSDSMSASEGQERAEPANQDRYQKLKARAYERKE
ncbi:hypothetical protein CIHG_04338 [Coccidioides immitis H538.4]|uniref:Uncharacterized protein n=1 Tax=Coccidioides immitis H538.4 TaxID=396776 RepID=A0A0J8RRF5_COCIT|nr:hypothetical protein CIHG_04338 [Coccidioides immitis H538.4]